MSMTQQRKPCLEPIRAHHLLMVRLPEYERNVRIVQGVYQAGDILEGVFIHCGTGEILRPVRYLFDKRTTLYFISSDKAVLCEWHYVVGYLPKDQCWGCSCFESRHHGYCGHIAEITEFISRIV